MTDALMTSTKNILAALVRASVAIGVTFVLLNVFLIAAVYGVHSHICNDGDLGGNLVLWIGFGLLVTIPLSVLTGCLVPLVKAKVSWRLVRNGMAIAVAAVMATYVVSYAAAVLAHAEQGPCAMKWTFVGPAAHVSATS